MTRANHCCSSWGGCQIPWGSIVKVVSSELTIGWCRRPTNYIGLDLQLFYCIGFVCQYTLYLTLRRKNIVLLTILQKTSFSCKINNKKTEKNQNFLREVVKLLVLNFFQTFFGESQLLEIRFLLIVITIICCS